MKALDATITLLAELAIVTLLMLGAAGYFGEPETHPTSKRGYVAEQRFDDTGSRDVTSGHGYWIRREERGR